MILPISPKYVKLCIKYHSTLDLVIDNIVTNITLYISKCNPLIDITVSRHGCYVNTIP